MLTPKVLYDACVLYPAPLRDLLMHLAMRALTSAIADQVQPKLEQKYLFPMEHDVMKTVMKEFDSPQKFVNLARSFFAKMTNQCLNYNLTKTTRSNFGEDQRFSTLNQVLDFETALERHCVEASKIVEKYSEEWFAKHKYHSEKGEIDRKEVQGFASYAFEKIKRELREGAKDDAA